MVSTLRGMRKYSTVRASAKLLGGMMQLSPSKSTKLFSSKFLGSTTVLWMLVNTLNSDRKSTRLNSSHLVISYAVFCLKTKMSELGHPVVPGGAGRRVGRPGPAVHPRRPALDGDHPVGDPGEQLAVVADEQHGLACLA